MTGTAGSMSVMLSRVVGSMLFAMARASRNTGLASSKVNGGSPETDVQVMVAVPPDVRPVGVLRVRAWMKGRRSVATLSFANMFEGR